MQVILQPSESSILKEYNLVSNHAYTIVGYDETTGIVKICNPHCAGVVTDIPIEVLSKYVNSISITDLRKGD